MEIIKFLGFFALILFPVSAAKTADECEGPDNENLFCLLRNLLQDNRDSFENLKDNAFIVHLPDNSEHAEWENDEVNFEGEPKDIGNARTAIRKLREEIEEIRGEAIFSGFLDDLLEAARAYDNVFDNLDDLGAKQGMISVSRHLAAEGHGLINVMLEIITEEFQNMKEVIFKSDRNLKRQEHKQILFDYVSLCKHNKPIGVAFSQLDTITTVTIDFLNNSTAACIETAEQSQDREEKNKLVEKIYNELDVGSSLVETALLNLRKAKATFDLEANNAMDMLFNVVRQIILARPGGGKYRFSKLH